MKKLAVTTGLVVFAFWMGKGYCQDAKELFIKYKCNKCHSIKALDIKPLESALKKKKEIRDLSGVGLKRTDPEWIKKWLRKEVKNEDGKKHKKKWKGTDEELDKVANWLVTLKTKIDEKEIKAWLEELRK